LPLNSLSGLPSRRHPFRAHLGIALQLASAGIRARDQIFQRRDAHGWLRRRRRGAGEADSQSDQPWFHPRLGSISLHATSSSFTPSTLTWKFCFASSSRAISITCSAPLAPITVGTPT